MPMVDASFLTHRRFFPRV